MGHRPDKNNVVDAASGAVGGAHQEPGGESGDQGENHRSPTGAPERDAGEGDEYCLSEPTLAGHSGNPAERGRDALDDGLGVTSRFFEFLADEIAEEPGSVKRMRHGTGFGPDL